MPDPDWDAPFLKALAGEAPLGERWGSLLGRFQGGGALQSQPTASMYLADWSALPERLDRWLRHVQVEFVGSLRHPASLLVSQGQQLREMKKEVQTLHAELTSVAQRVQQLEQLFGIEGGPEDPRLAWCSSHRELLALHPESYVAIHPERGIVIAERDQATFARRLDALSEGERAELLLSHTAYLL